MARRTRTPLPFLLSLVFAALLIVLAVVFRGPAASLLWRVLGPVVALRDSFGGDPAALRAELASTTAALADRDLLAAQNAQLRAELNRAPSGSEIAASVLMGPPGVPYDTLLVDAGSAQGVVSGA